MKKVVCFCRVSSLVQDLTNQKNEVLRAIAKDGFEKNEIVIVEGKESAIKLDELERETLNELKEVIAQNTTITDVYFYAIDRLARKVSIVLSIVDQMTAQGINLHFLNPYPMQTMRNGKEDSMGKMFLTFLSIGAEMEMKMKNERFAVKRKAMRENGQLIGGSVLYGYFRNKNGYPEINDEEAATVRDIFDMYVNNGVSMHQIAKRLVCNGQWNVDDYKTLNSAIVKVSNIINNTAYSGRQAKQYDSKEEKTIKYPAIVDAEMQDKAMQIAANTKKEKGTSNIYYAKGLVKTLIGEDYYTLSPIKGNNSYSVNYNGVIVGVNINVIDTIAWRTAQNLYKLFQSYENFSEPNRLKDLILEDKMKIKKLEPIFKAFQEREDRLNGLYELGRYSIDKYQSQYEKLTKEKQVYINEKVRLENEINRYKVNIEKMNNLKMEDIDVSTFTDEERKNLCKEFITMIEVIKNDKCDYNILIHPNERIFKVGVVVPSYHYNCSGGVKQLTEILGEEYNITDEIEIRYTSPRRKKG